MKQETKDFLNLWGDKAGILEYTFGTLGVLSALPAVITYLIIVKFIQLGKFIYEQVKALVNKAWK